MVFKKKLLNLTINVEITKEYIMNESIRLSITWKPFISVEIVANVKATTATAIPFGALRDTKIFYLTLRFFFKDISTAKYRTMI